MAATPAQFFMPVHFNHSSPPTLHWQPKVFLPPHHKIIQTSDTKYLDWLKYLFLLGITETHILSLRIVLTLFEQLPSHLNWLLFKLKLNVQVSYIVHSNQTCFTLKRLMNALNPWMTLPLEAYLYVTGSYAILGSVSPGGFRWLQSLRCMLHYYHISADTDNFQRISTN